jgi:hypothetical protein
MFFYDFEFPDLEIKYPSTRICRIRRGGQVIFKVEQQKVSNIENES